MTILELRRCVPCHKCGEKPFVADHPAGKTGKWLQCKHLTHEKVCVIGINSRKAWNKIQKGSEVYGIRIKRSTIREASKEKALERMLIDHPDYVGSFEQHPLYQRYYEAARSLESIEIYKEHIAARNAQIKRLGKLYENKKKKLQQLKEENDRLKAIIDEMSEILRNQVER